MTYKETADLVAAEIARSGETVTSVAIKSGIPRTTLDRKLRGHSDFGVGELAQIAKTLKISPSELLPQAFQSEDAA